MEETETSLIKIIEYNWENEKRNFEETFEMSISPQDTLEEWIEICELSSNKFMSEHIFYHLMKIKYLLNY